MSRQKASAMLNYQNSGLRLGFGWNFEGRIDGALTTLGGEPADCAPSEAAAKIPMRATRSTARGRRSGKRGVRWGFIDEVWPAEPTSGMPIAARPKS